MRIRHGPATVNGESARKQGPLFPEGDGKAASRATIRESGDLPVRFSASTYADRGCRPGRGLFMPLPRIRWGALFLLSIQGCAGGESVVRCNGWRGWTVVLLVAAQVMTAVSAYAQAELVAADASAAVPKGAVGQADFGDIMRGAADFLLAQDALSDWAVFALARAGFDVPAGAVEALKRRASDAGAFRLPTDIERTALALAAVGERPAETDGLDLIRMIATHDRLVNQGTMAAVFALITLDAGPYDVPDGAVWTRQALVDWLLARQREDGGWGYAEGAASSVDVTAAALAALAPYRSQQAAAKAVERGLAFLAARQQDDGGFAENGGSSESVAQVLIALASLGLPADDARFVRTGGGLVDRLLSFRQADGGFAHLAGEPSDAMATEQALMALAALELQKRGEALYYRIRPQVAIRLRVEGPSGPIVDRQVRAFSTLDGLGRLREEGALTVETESTAYGPYVRAINGIEASGQDGWMFNVRREGRWLFPAEGMASYPIRGGDEVVVYYGASAQVVADVEVEPAELKAGQPFTVRVTSQGYDPADWQLKTRPAAGIVVRVGERTAVADESGEARFDPGLPAGVHELELTGYRSGGSPVYVRDVRRLTVAAEPARATTAARVRVEGPDGVLAEGAVSADDAFEALELVLRRAQVPYEIKAYDFGKMVTSIGGYAGGADAYWLYDVLRGGAWEHPQVGLEQFRPESGDEIVVYYASAETVLVDSVAIHPALPSPGEPFAVTVTLTRPNWEKGSWDRFVSAGVPVRVGGQTAVTDADGRAVFAGLPAGRATMEVGGVGESGGTAAGGVGRVVRHPVRLAVFADRDDVSPWAVEPLAKAAAAGLVEGRAAASFVPREPVTRAEFVALLVRLFGLSAVDAPGGGAGFADVPAGAWYAEAVAAARAFGVVDGTGEGRFSPERPVTREQAAVMLARAAQAVRVAAGRGDKTSSGSASGGSAASGSSFADATAVSSYAAQAVREVAALGWMDGVGGGRFDPAGVMTREQAATVAARVLETRR